MPNRPRLTPAIADIRRSVRRSLANIAPNSNGVPLVFVALSGGADSSALAGALSFEARKAKIQAGAIIVDHQLQENSDLVAAEAAEKAKNLGLDPVIIKKVFVDETGGPEAAARSARYAALSSVVDETGAKAVFLAHTLDDQAETVLLGLARGSGAASLQGMAEINGFWHRPLLGITRKQTEQFCKDSGLAFWSDPHNTDERFTRVRVRTRILPLLEQELGPGIAQALARTAEQLREDNEAFQQQIEEIIEDIVEPAEAGIAVSVSALSANPAALRQRIIRYIVQSEFGVSLNRSQTLAAAELITAWRGQERIDLPGVIVSRNSGKLFFTSRIEQ